jgi:hypothetical protein
VRPHQTHLRLTTLRSGDIAADVRDWAIDDRIVIARRQSRS